MVTFKTNHHGNVFMFDRDARTMLRLMGQRSHAPGALNAEDVPAALVHLKKAIETHGSQPSETDDRRDEDEDREPPVLLRTRAFPLIELLTAAAEHDDYVIWE